MTTPYYEHGGITIYHGDAREVLPELEPELFAACVTDPPYDLTSGTAGSGFMGKSWDGTGVAFQPATWQAVAGVCKPGAHLLAFGGTRTHHRLMVAIEDAGWEIRDCLMWFYGSGFPKSLDISKAIDDHYFGVWLNEHPKEKAQYQEQMRQAKGDQEATQHVKRKFRKAAGAEREVVGKKGGRYATPKQDFRGGQHHSGADTSKTAMFDDITAPATEAAKTWDGWGTALKPAFEPIILAMKPLDGTFAQNAIKHGVAGINVDGCRVGTEEKLSGGGSPILRFSGQNDRPCWGEGYKRKPTEGNASGRWPANLILSHHPECVQVTAPCEKCDGTGWMVTDLVPMALCPNCLSEEGGCWIPEAENCPECGTKTTERTIHENKLLCNECCGECVQVGTKKVKGIKGGTGHHQNSVYGKLSYDEGQPVQDYADADGLETVEAWECHEGGVVDTFEFRCGSFAVTPVSCLEDLSRFVEGVTQQIAQSMASPRSHSEGKYSWKDYASCHALGLLKLPSYRACCPSCRRLCDELAHVFLKCGQVSARQLADVQKHVFQFLGLYERSQTSLRNAHQSSLGGSSQTEHAQDTLLNNASAYTRLCKSLAEMSFYKSGKLLAGWTCERLPNNTHESNTSESCGSYRKAFDSACNDAVSRVLFSVACLVSSDYVSIGIVPSRIELSSCPVRMLDEQSGERPAGSAVAGNEPSATSKHAYTGGWNRVPSSSYGDTGGASRFYYCSKASSADRGNLPAQDLPLFGESIPEFRNTHPTVKPLELMRYLLTLLSTPTGGTILDPFMGSGTTLVAAKQLGRKAIGIELEEESCEIAAERLGR